MNFRNFIVLVSTILIIFSCDSTDNNSDPPIGDAVIFDLPTSMTGNTSKTIETTTVSIINDFSNYGRYQLQIADFWAYQIRRMINDLEVAGLFESDVDFVHEFKDAENYGDIARWTTGPGSDEYLLEWWKKQSNSSFQKFFELKFDYYGQSSNAIEVRGWAMIDLSADENFASTGYIQLPAFVKLEFDSAKADSNNQKWIRVIMTDFQIDSVGGLQNCQIEAWKDALGMVTLNAAVSVPGVSSLNYGSTAENRFYLITGKGDNSNATLQLAMPLDAYTNDANAFASNLSTLSTIGDTIAEYYADNLRDGSVDSNNILNILTTFTNYTLNSASSTEDIRAACREIDPSLDESIDDLQLLMSIENPIYFQAGGYAGFGPSLPSGYPDPAEIPSGADLISQTALANLSISINFNDPSDTPPNL